ncbi:MAG: hypothetical protein K2K73_00020 [Ureaplasma sp.]|nr:hypothetical protein [Ureaplasma sp.]
MSKTVKKKVIGLVAGIAIIAGSVSTAVILANLANRNILNYLITYKDLLKIRTDILINWDESMKCV